MEVLFISVYPASNLQQAGRLADISLFCLPHGQAAFNSGVLCPKNKNPTARSLPAVGF
jgi:hypothetical protein